MARWKESLKNIVEKGENADNQHFLLSHNIFFTSQNKFQTLKYILSSANAFNFRLV